MLRNFCITCLLLFMVRTLWDSNMWQLEVTVIIQVLLLISLQMSIYPIYLWTITNMKVWSSFFFAPSCLLKSIYFTFYFLNFMFKGSLFLFIAFITQKYDHIYSPFPSLSFPLSTFCFFIWLSTKSNCWCHACISVWSSPTIDITD